MGRRIPEDHFLRKLNRTLDLSFVREEVAAFYGRNGNVSVDPVVIMKMMLLLFLDNVKSERELVKIIPLRIDYLWYLGYGLEDAVYSEHASHKYTSREFIVLRATPVIRLTPRMEFPSTSAATICVRFSVLSLFICSN